MVPLIIIREVEVMAIEDSVAAVTVRLTPALVMPDNTAVIAVVRISSVCTAVTKPCEPSVLLIVAVAVSLELQITLVVKSWVVPSL